MPRFAANLSFLFTELPFLNRFEAAAKAGFKAVEFLNPFDAPKAEIAARAQFTQRDGEDERQAASGGRREAGGGSVCSHEAAFPTDSKHDTAHCSVFTAMARCRPASRSLRCGGVLVRP